MKVYIGCAGWSIPKRYADRFPAGSTHLARYAARLTAVEINSSFYRQHRGATYERWATLVPEHFRFAVKMARQITHVTRLAEPALLDDFLAGPLRLGTKLGPLLVQLPPSLTFQAEIAATFFAALRQRFAGQVVCEPRHPGWFTAEAGQLLARFRVARVAADPAPVSEGEQPGGWPLLVYYRLHGSPRKYYSSYSMDYLERLADRLRKAAAAATVWCIFDNTASGAATENALTLLSYLAAGVHQGTNSDDRFPAVLSGIRH